MVDEHAEEQPADELAETPDLEDAGTMDNDASKEVPSDSEVEVEESPDTEASEGTDEEQVDPEMIEAEEEEAAEMESVSESEEEVLESEEDTTEELDDAEEDQQAEEDEAGEAPAEEDILPEDAGVQEENESEEAVKEEPVEAIEPEDEANMEAVAEDDRHWFVVHCYSGYENKVRHNLEQRIETMGMKNKIFDVVVPTEEEIEVKDGKRRTVERRVFPGYILVQMLMDEDSWYVVRNTPGVTGFVGMGNEPTPLVKRMEAEAPRIKVTYKTGQKVRIIDGPFNDFIGTVSDIDMERAKVRVMVSFFGRETPVELDFLQVEKA